VDVDERRQRILSLARRDGRVDVGSLARELEVAVETVRHDLRTLVDRGVLQRVHGGAIPVESAGFETSLAHRVGSHASERRRIAVAPAQRLHGAEIAGSWSPFPVPPAGAQATDQKRHDWLLL
jgi:DeoR family fructose operon transcriptional repressor